MGTVGGKILGLTMSGGGARGAYQGGALRAIYEISKFKSCPFSVISGISVGSINAMALAANAEDFDTATSIIWNTWTSLSVDKIFKTEARVLLKTGATWMADLSLGSLLGRPKMTYLLDTSPLRSLLNESIDVKKIAANIESGLLHAVALSATDYHTAKSVTFFAGAPDIASWDGNSGLGVRTTIKIDHIMASTAIPIFFAPVRVEQSEYGDGGIALRAPMSPIIHLGAQKAMVIGLENHLVQQPSTSANQHEDVTVGDIAGTLLTSLFLRSLDSDIERLKETNKVVALLERAGLAKEYKHSEIPLLSIRPSRDLGRIDVDQFSRFPFALRHLFKGLGITDRKAWDLISFLAFDRTYAETLLNLGYNDVMNSREQIVDFFAKTDV